MFDVTRRDTFKHVEIWKRDVDSKCGDIPSLLLGNKSDLDHDISEQELVRAGRLLNFTQAHFTTARTFLMLERQVRSFAEHVKNEAFDQVSERKDDVEEDRPIVLSSVTEGRTKCVC